MTTFIVVYSMPNASSTLPGAQTLVAIMMVKRYLGSAVAAAFRPLVDQALVMSTDRVTR